MYRHQVALADELVKLDVVYVATRTGLRRMQHQEQMIVVAMNLRHLIPMLAIPNRERMEPEGRRQGLHGLLVARRHVDPDQPVGAR